MKKINTFLPLIWALWLPIHSAIGADPDNSSNTDAGPWIVHIHDTEQTVVDTLYQRFEHVGRYPSKNLLVLHVDSSDELSWLRDEGFDVVLAAEETQLLRQKVQQMRAGKSLTSIPGFECYRTVEQMHQTGADIALQYPTLARWNDVGDSWEKATGVSAGYDLMSLVLSNQAIKSTKPKLLVTGSTHPRELATAELVTRFAEMLVDSYGRDPDVTWLIDYHEIHLLLVLNPDGRKMAESGLLWRKNTNNNFCANSENRGIDLNRNMSFQWNGCNGSSSSQCAQTFRGPGAASEPESQALEAYMRSLFPDQRDADLTAPANADATGLYLDVHSFGQVVLSTWGCQSSNPPHPNGSEVQTLGRKYGFYSGYEAHLGSLGSVDGSTKDFAYGELGVPGYTIELGTTFFQACDFFESAILPNNLKALLQAAKHSRSPYRTPSGPDSIVPTAISHAVEAGQTFELNVSADDTLYDQSQAPTEPTQNISTISAFVNEPPWSDASTPLAMVPTDGAFDSPVEEAQVLIDSTSMSVGKHTIYTQSTDALDNPGAPSATFVYVIDPNTSPTVSGTVFDSHTNDPIEATIRLDHLETTSNGSNGQYEIQVPPGDFQLSAEADDYIASNAGHISLDKNQQQTHHFLLQPLYAVFSDDIENGNAGWVANGTWAITTERANSPTHAWSDSPGGNYVNDVEASLTSPPIDLSGFIGTSLKFFHQFDFETGFDFGHVEVSIGDSNEWETVASYSGFGADNWAQVVLQLPQLDDKSNVYFRFRVSSDSGTTADGWFIDDIGLRSALEPAFFLDGFENELH